MNGRMGRVRSLATLVVALGAGAAVSGADGASVTSAPTWSVLTPLGSSLNLAAISCPTINFCAIANDNDADDDAGTMYTVSGANGLEGGTVSAPSVISKYDGSPDSVSCPTSTFCMAIDDGGAVYAFNGKTWSGADEIDDIPPANQTAVSCASSKLCLAVDGTGSVFSFNGSTWSAADDIDAQTPTVALSCAPGGGLCMAIDGRGDAMSFNGTSWSSPQQIAGSGLDSVSCASTSFCIAVGSSGYTVRFNGSGWGNQTLLARWPLLGISCASSSYCVGVNSGSDVFSLGNRDSFPQAQIKLRTKRATVYRDRFLYLSMTCPHGPRDCDGRLGVYLKGMQTPIVAESQRLLGAGVLREERLFFTKAQFDSLLSSEHGPFPATVTSSTGAVVGTVTLKLVCSGSCSGG